MNILKSKGTWGIKKIYTSPVIPIVIFCGLIVYFFHFDVSLSGDSAWAGIAAIQFFRKGLQCLSHIRIWGFSYTFGYHLIQYFLLKLLSQGVSSSLMEAMNLMAGAVSVCNGALIYGMFRKLSFSKILSSGMALLYFFIPKVFQLSLYANPNVYAIFFFILSNIFFISYMLCSKKRDLFLLLFFSILSLCARFDVIFFYVSFISWGLVLAKSFKKSLCVYFFTMLVSCTFFIIVHKVVFNRGFLEGIAYHGGIPFDRDLLNVRARIVAIGNIACSAGMGLVFMSLFFIARCLYLRDLRVPLAMLIWVFPILFFVLLEAKYDVGRYCVPSFIGFLLPIGFGVHKGCARNTKRTVILLIIVGTIFFGTMPLPYFLVKRYYPLRRRYLPGERIIIETTPIGNIFMNAYFLRKEKRQAWYSAAEAVRNNNKVIAVVDYTSEMPYVYFLYYLHENVERKKIIEGVHAYTAFNKEFVFIDVGLEKDRVSVPVYDRRIILDFLNNPSYSEFSLLIPVHICRRDPQLCEDMQEKCIQDERIFIEEYDYPKA